MSSIQILVVVVQHLLSL